MSISVLFPQPDGPTIEINSPGLMSIETGLSASNDLPAGLVNVFATSAIEMGRPAAFVCSAVSFTGVPFSDPCRCGSVSSSITSP